MVEAKHWKTLDDGRVACELCPHRCTISDGGHGICRARVNRGGTLYAENFGQCVSVALDPIEKKPLYHVCPGKSVLSIACNSCNFDCDFCQNWTISQEPARTAAVSPEELVNIAAEGGSFGIAYTYTEPLVWFEYLLEAGTLAREKGLMNILVTNGAINPDPLKELLPLVGAMNVDLKSMRPDFYTTYCHIDALDAVKHTIAEAAGTCHVEVTNLVIPTLNDSDEDFRDLVGFIAGIRRTIPLHFSRYFPAYKMKIEPTPVATLERAAEIAREELDYVYLGNVGLGQDADTVCPQCGNVLVRRAGYLGDVVGVRDGACSNCGRPADFVWCD